MVKLCMGIYEKKRNNQVKVDLMFQIFVVMFSLLLDQLLLDKHDGFWLQWKNEREGHFTHVELCGRSVSNARSIVASQAHN